MQLNAPSTHLQKLREDDERGLQYHWKDNAYLMNLFTVTLQNGDFAWTSKPSVAMQDTFANALHSAQVILVSEADVHGFADGTGETDHDWDEQPIWFEFATPLRFTNQVGNRAWPGCLIYQEKIGTAQEPSGERPCLLMIILIDGEDYWAIPSVKYKTLNAMCREIRRKTAHEKRRAGCWETLIGLLASVPRHRRRPDQHEAGAILSARMNWHLQCVENTVPITSARMQDYFISGHQRWDSRVFVPTDIIGLSIEQCDNMTEKQAQHFKSATAALGAWRGSKYVYRIDEDVIQALRELPVPERLPTVWPGLTNQAIYVPVPGGMKAAHQLGFFAMLDCGPSGESPRLVLVTESRSYGGVGLVPISLALGENIKRQLTDMACTEGQTNYPPEMAGQVHQNLSLMLNLISYIGSREAEIITANVPRFVTENTLCTSPDLHLIDVGISLGNRWRARQVRQQAHHVWSGDELGIRFKDPHPQQNGAAE